LFTILYTVDTTNTSNISDNTTNDVIYTITEKYQLPISIWSNNTEINILPDKITEVNGGSDYIVSPPFYIGDNNEYTFLDVYIDGYTLMFPDSMLNRYDKYEDCVNFVNSHTRNISANHTILYLYSLNNATTDTTSNTTNTTNISYNTTNISYNTTNMSGDIIVTFDPNGGEDIYPQTKQVILGSPYGTLVIPIRIGYVFDGWSKEDGTRVSESTLVEESISHTLYAQWIPISNTTNDVIYTITEKYRLHNGEVSPWDDDNNVNLLPEKITKLNGGSDYFVSPPRYIGDNNEYIFSYALIYGDTNEYPAILYSYENYVNRVNRFMTNISADHMILYGYRLSGNSTDITNTTNDIIYTITEKYRLHNGEVSPWDDENNVNLLPEKITKVSSGSDYLVLPPRYIGDNNEYVFSRAEVYGDTNGYPAILYSYEDYVNRVNSFTRNISADQTIVYVYRLSDNTTNTTNTTNTSDNTTTGATTSNTTNTTTGATTTSNTTNTTTGATTTSNTTNTTTGATTTSNTTNTTTGATTTSNTTNTTTGATTTSNTTNTTTGVTTTSNTTNTNINIAPTLLVNEQVTIKQGSSIDLRSLILEARDSNGNDLKNDVSIIGEVNTAKAGAYTINYSVTDKNGMTSTAKSIVSVKGAETVIIGDNAIDAHDFSLSISEAQTITKEQILTKAGVNAWNIPVGEDLTNSVQIDKTQL